MRMRIGKALLASGLAVLLTACGGGGGGGGGGDADGGGTPVRGGELRIGLEGNWLPIDPLKVGNLSERQVATAIYDTLLGVDANGEFVPMLATEWTTQDAQVYDVTLRDGVTFHDGEPLNAAAVVTFYDWLTDPANECRCLAEMEVLDRVEATGDMSVRFHLNQPFPAFLSFLADVPGMITSPAAIQQYGTDLGRNPVGAGPFAFVSEVVDDNMVVERYENYWDADNVYVDRIVYRAMPDTQSRFAAVQSGDINIMQTPGAPEIAGAESAGNLKLIELGGIGTQFFMLNATRAPFDDVRARLALTQATDVETLNATVLEGLYPGVQGPITEASWAFSEVEDYPAFDAAAASALVDEIGGLSFTIKTSERYNALVTALQAMWAEAGIEANIEFVDGTAQVATAVDGDYQALMYRWTGRWDPDQNTYQHFHSDGGRNYTNISDPELDRLLEDARRNPDQDARAATYAEVVNRLAGLMPQIYLHELAGFLVVRDDVQGIEPVADWVIRPQGVWIQG